MKYVVIGSSAAGVNAIRELRRLDKECQIVLISKDKDIYSRCILHEYLAGKRTIERLRFVEKDFETLYKVDWMKGREAIGLDREKKEVILDGDERVSYDKLLIATGSHTFFPPIKNMLGSPNMIGFRNIDDIEVLKEVAKTKKNISATSTISRSSRKWRRPKRILWSSDQALSALTARQVFWNWASRSSCATSPAGFSISSSIRKRHRPISTHLRRTELSSTMASVSMK